MTPSTAFEALGALVELVASVIGGLIGLATPKGAKDRAGHHPVAVALFAVGALTMLGVAGWVLLTA